MKKFAIVALFIFLFAGCKDAEKKNPIIIPDKFHGIYYDLLQNGIKWQITETRVIWQADSIYPNDYIIVAADESKITAKNEGANGVTNAEFFFSNDRVLKGELNNSISGKYDLHLIKDITPATAVLKGTIVNSAMTSSKNLNSSRGIGLGGLSGIEVILKDVNSPDNQYTAKTDADGNFIVSDLGMGHIYEVSSGYNSDRVTIANSFTDMGYLPNEQQNVKAFIVNDQNLYTVFDCFNPGVVCGGVDPQKQLRFFVLKRKNYSAVPVRYDLTFDTGIGYPETFSPNYFYNIIKKDDYFKAQALPYFPGADNYDYYSFYIDIDVKDPLASDYVDKIINIQITCNNNDVWNDRAVLRVYKSGIKIYSESAYIAFVNNSAPSVFPAIAGNLARSVPEFQGTDVVICFSGLSKNYSFGFNNPMSYLNLPTLSPIDNNSYEPNNSYDTAYAVWDNFINVSYMEPNGLDFYKLKKSTLTGIPSNVNAANGTADSVTITWDPAAEAEKYYIYRFLVQGSTDENISIGANYYSLFSENMKILSLNGTTSTSYVDTTAISGQYYYYHVKSFSSAQGYSGMTGAVLNRGWRN